MCGLAGQVWWRDGAVEQRDIDASQRRLVPRGPDGEGVVTAASTRATLWHRRLAIVDLSAAGAQPMVSADARHVLVANGEIYNHQALRQELTQKGHRFVGGSDNEVLLHGFRAWGPAVVNRLDGIFAFAVWDDESQSLFLARDRMGVKPLYFRADRSGVAFASTPSALPQLQRRPDRRAFDHYWIFGHFDHGQSAFAGVKQIRPAHRVVLTSSGGDQERYHTPNADAEAEGDRPWAAQVEDALVRSVEDQLMSDVPTGVFLSGGIDSGLLCALGARGATHPLSAFSLGYAGHDDEVTLAQATARHCGVRHHVLAVTPDDALRALPEVVDAFDEPLGDSSVVPTFLISSLARREGVPVVLSGDGGDELFAGYRRYGAMTRMHRRRWRIDGRWPHLDRQARGFRHAAAVSVAPGRWLRRVMGYERLAKQFGPAVARSMPVGTPPGLAFQWADLTRYLPLALLTKVDRASMAHGVEVRVPLLSDRLVALALRIPSSVHHRSGITKPLLRAVAQRYLPAAVVAAPKRGFALPQDGPMATLPARLRPLLLHRPALVEHDLLGPRAFREAMHATRSTHFWTVALAELWARRHLAGATVSDLRTSLAA